VRGSKGLKMIPKIGDKISVQHALDLCVHYKLAYLIERLSIYKSEFNEWTFDGASLVPDPLFSKIFQIPNLVEIALRHDLKYAYGETGNEAEKQRADQEFRQELLADGAPKIIALLMYSAVVLFGGKPFKFDFSWGFARKRDY
jgi:hypothetical protein